MTIANVLEEAVVSKKRGTRGNPVQSTYFSFSIWVITPKIGRAENTSSHTVSNFSAGPSRGGALRARAYTLTCTVTETHAHTGKKRVFFSAFVSPLCPQPLPHSLPPFPFPPARSVSISCDIPFCFLITALFFVLLVPNNFIDGGHKPIHSLSRAACREQRQIHGAGALVPPAARILWVCAEQLYIATLGGKVLF